MDSLTFEQVCFLKGVLYSAGFLLEEFEGTEEAGDYARSIIGEAAKDFGPESLEVVLTYSGFSIEKDLKILQIIDEIKRGQ